MGLKSINNVPVIGLQVRPTQYISNKVKELDGIMNYKRVKNGFKITVKKWSDEVVVTRLSDNQTVVTKFDDHIKAVAVAQAL